MTRAERLKLATRIADVLFRHIVPDLTVTRLVQETAPGKLDGPGWCKEAIINVIEKKLRVVK